MSRSSRSTSSKFASRQFDAHSSSSWVRWDSPSSLEIWLLETSRTRSEGLASRPLRSVMALCETYNSSRLGSFDSPCRLVSRFDWMDRMRRLDRESRFYSVRYFFAHAAGADGGGDTLSSVILFFPNHSSSRDFSESRFSIS